jgi:hypothetical protein
LTGCSPVPHGWSAVSVWKYEQLCDYPAISPMTALWDFVRLWSRWQELSLKFFSWDARVVLPPEPPGNAKLYKSRIQTASAKTRLGRAQRRQLPTCLRALSCNAMWGWPWIEVLETEWFAISCTLADESFHGCAAGAGIVSARVIGVVGLLAHLEATG